MLPAPGAAFLARGATTGGVAAALVEDDLVEVPRQTRRERDRGDTHAQRSERAPTARTTTPGLALRSHGSEIRFLLHRNHRERLRYDACPPLKDAVAATLPALDCTLELSFRVEASPQEFLGGREERRVVLPVIRQMRCARSGLLWFELASQIVGAAPVRLHDASLVTLTFLAARLGTRFGLWVIDIEIVHKVASGVVGGARQSIGAAPDAVDNEFDEVGPRGKVNVDVMIGRVTTGGKLA